MQKKKKKTEKTNEQILALRTDGWTNRAKFIGHFCQHGCPKAQDKRSRGYKKRQFSTDVDILQQNWDPI